jgi:hypothetical protein
MKMKQEKTLEANKFKIDKCFLLLVATLIVIGCSSNTNYHLNAFINKNIVSTNDTTQFFSNYLYDCFDWKHVIPQEGTGTMVIIVHTGVDSVYSKIEVLYGVHTSLDNEVLRCLWQSKEEFCRSGYYLHKRKSYRVKFNLDCT